MKLVQPGAVASRPSASPDAVRRQRLGRAAGALLSAGWLLSLALAVLVGPRPDASGTMLALAGAAIGVVLANRRWDRQPERSLHVLVVVGALHAAAAMVALDPAAEVSVPLFIAVAVLIGAVARDRMPVLVCAASLAGVALAVALLGPARAPHAVAHALVLIPALLLAASLTAFAGAARRTRAVRAAIPTKGDPSLVHAALARRAHLDPDRFAALAMDIDLQEGRGMSVAEGNRLLADIAEALISRERQRAMARRRATELLVERIERTVANIELEELGWFNFEQAYAHPFEDSAEAAELIRRADEALREARARRGRRPMPVEDVASIVEAEASRLN
jgi:hypothetical protein